MPDPETCAFCAPQAGATFNPQEQHRECAMRAALGGIGHLTNHDFWCVVVGDPDAHLGYRESAMLVWQWVSEYGLDAAADKTP